METNATRLIPKYFVRNLDINVPLAKCCCKTLFLGPLFPNFPYSNFPHSYPPKTQYGYFKIQSEFWTEVCRLAYKALIHACSWCGGLNKEHTISLQWGPNKFEHLLVCHSRKFIVQTLTQIPRMLQKFTKHGKYCMQNNQRLTETLVE